MTTAKKKLIPFKPKLGKEEELVLFPDPPKPLAEDATETERTGHQIYSALYEQYNTISIVVQHQAYSWTKTWLNTYNLLEAKAKKQAKEEGREPSFYDTDKATEAHNKELFSVCLVNVLGFDADLKDVDRDYLYDQLDGMMLASPVVQRILSALIPSVETKKK